MNRILLELLQLKILLGEGLINFWMLFLISTKLFGFSRVGSKLFDSMIEEGKKQFQKKNITTIKNNISLFPFRRKKQQS